MKDIYWGENAVTKAIPNTIKIWLNEEKAANEKLSEIAVHEINEEAVQKVI